MLKFAFLNVQGSFIPAVFVCEAISRILGA